MLQPQKHLDMKFLILIICPKVVVPLMHRPGGGVKSHKLTLAFIVVHQNVNWMIFYLAMTSDSEASGGRGGSAGSRLCPPPGLKLGVVCEDGC